MFSHRATTVLLALQVAVGVVPAEIMIVPRRIQRRVTDQIREGGDPRESAIAGSLPREIRGVDVGRVAEEDECRRVVGLDPSPDRRGSRLFVGTGAEDDSTGVVRNGPGLEPPRIVRRTVDRIEVAGRGLEIDDFEDAGIVRLRGAGQHASSNRSPGRVRESDDDFAGLGASAGDPNRRRGEITEGRAAVHRDHRR